MSTAVSSPSLSFFRPKRLHALAAGILLGISALALPASNIVDLLPLKKGYLVATCASSSYQFQNGNQNAPVVAVMDASTGELLSAGTGSASGATYAWRRFHNEVAVQNPGVPSPAQEWTMGNLGEVFGVTLDDETPPNIYVAATSAYGSVNPPPGGGPTSVYKLNGADGTISEFVELNPASLNNASLGDVDYYRATDGVTKNWYVSNLDDGVIYRVNSAGAIVGTHDHGAAIYPLAHPLNTDATSQVFTQSGRRIWAVKAYNGRLYYSVWNAFNATANTGLAQQQIYSIALTPTGAFTGVPLLEVTLPSECYGNGMGGISGGTDPVTFATLTMDSLPVSDLDFGSQGQMLLAERYHQGAGLYTTHHSRVLEYTGVSGAWVASPVNKFLVGNYSNWSCGEYHNSAGGVALDCDDILWASADAIEFHIHAPYFIYGLIGIQATGNTVDAPVVTANAYCMDLDDDTLGGDKTYIGEIEIVDNDCGCFAIEKVETPCPEPGQPFPVTLTLTNNSGQNGSYLWFGTCPAAELPAGAVTALPLPYGNVPTPFNWPAGATVTLPTLNFPAALNGQTVCFVITLLDRNGGFCCTDKICVELPDCACFLVREKIVKCIVGSDGLPKYQLSMTIQNLETYTFHHAVLLPPNLFSPSVIALAPPIAPGGTGTIQTCVTGQAGEKVCFDLSFHSENRDLCCSKPCCIELPPCEVGQPDLCEINRAVQCCKDTGTASVAVKIFNNSLTPQSYSWVFQPLPAGTLPGCNAVLDNADITPSNGVTGIIPAGGCWSGVVTIICNSSNQTEPLQPGSCAAYQFCFQRQVTDPVFGADRICCTGQVSVPGQGVPEVKPVVAGADHFVALQPGQPSDYSFDLTLFSTAPVRLLAYDTHNILGFGTPILSAPSAESTLPLPTLTLLNQPLQTSFLLTNIPAAIVGKKIRVQWNVTLPVRPAIRSGFSEEIVLVRVDEQGRSLGALLATPAHYTRRPTQLRIDTIAPISTTSAPLTGPIYSIAVPTERGRKYKIQRCANLKSPWHDVPCRLEPEAANGPIEVFGTGSVLTWFEPVSTPPMFFRAVEVE